jgi:hypothetical protein
MEEDRRLPPASTGENAFSRLKRIVGTELRARNDLDQNMEAMVACDVLNRMLSLGLPDSVAIISV